jgi:SpoVK/Ycf46/Vps4 family AAA+-type ATPase
MSFIIHFPDPDPPIRRRIWEYHLAQLPELDRSDRIRVPFLAEAVEVTGGDIRNIVMAAAYEAVSRHEPVGMRHIVAATMREYHKLGKVIPDHGFVVSSPR